MLNRRRQLVREPRDLTLMRGWTNYHGGSARNGLSVISGLGLQLSTRETRRSLNASRKALKGRTSYDD